MTDEVVIYVSPPSTDRGPWRIRWGHRQADERATEQEALKLAAKYAQAAEASGATAVVKLERPDGTWEAYRA